jgi:prepilin-type processing-associated H-X9-DG protein
LVGCGKKRAPEEGATAAPEGAGPGAPKELPAEVRASQEKLRQIGKAFVAEWPGFPAGYVDRGGRLILSWRVALLPRLGQEELFRQFQLGEPWGGPNNKKLLARVPDVYRPVKGPAPEGHTYYRAFVGEQAVFQPRRSPSVQWGPKTQFEQFSAWGPRIIDGTSYTLLVAEAAEPVPWTKPDELPYDPNRPLPRLGGPFGGDFNALFADGSVGLIPRTAPERLVRALITPAGQEPVDLSEIGLPDPRRQATANPEPPPVPGQKGTVTGRVTFQGLPVPGGVVIFHTGVGNYEAQLGADGSYTIADMPVGYAGVVVRTSKVAIPAKYGNPMYSGLGYVVKGGKQTYDISLLP